MTNRVIKALALSALGKILAISATKIAAEPAILKGLFSQLIEIVTKHNK